MPTGRDGQTSSSRDGSDQYPKSRASMEIPRHLRTTVNSVRSGFEDTEDQGTEQRSVNDPA